jgi:hypothetical protein
MILSPAAFQFLQVYIKTNKHFCQPAKKSLRVSSRSFAASIKNRLVSFSVKLAVASNHFWDYHIPATNNNVLNIKHLESVK